MEAVPNLHQLITAETARGRLWDVRRSNRANRRLELSEAARAELKGLRALEVDEVESGEEDRHRGNPRNWTKDKMDKEEQSNWMDLLKDGTVGGSCRREGSPQRGQIKPTSQSSLENQQVNSQCMFLCPFCRVGIHVAR